MSEVISDPGPDDGEKSGGGVTGPADEGAGCFPAIVASTLIMGMMFFIGCALMAWVIYGKRTELAVRTLENSYVPVLEQSRLSPEEKQALIAQLDTLIVDLKAQKYENWQSAGVMQRLTRLPVLQWGELRAVQSAAEKLDPQLGHDAALHLSRLRRGIELNQITSLDLEDVLRPVTRPDDSELQRSLTLPLKAEGVREVIDRAKLVADVNNVPVREYPDVRIEAIVRRQIEAGLKDGTY